MTEDRSNAFLRRAKSPRWRLISLRHAASIATTAIYVGGGRVIHYAGLARGLRRGPVEEVSLEQLAHGRPVCVRTGRATFDRAEVVRRARRRLGEAQYRLLTNNCEHFCQWCLCGDSRSDQVEGLSRLLSLRAMA